MATNSHTFSRYLPADRQSRNWGWRLLDAGRQVIQPGSPYPAPGHPLGYQFDQLGKRTLDEFQAVFIAEGKGEFESRSSVARSIGTGDCCLIFPGEWHHYQPDSRTGWSEYWLGFRGQDAERVMASFFSPSEPVLHPVRANEILQLFEQLLYWIRHPVAGVEQILASHVPLILAHLQADSPETNMGKWNNIQLIMEAKSHILKNTDARTDLQQLATRLGVSYSKFRNLFKEQTGYSPREFENRVKLNRARDLLQSGQYSVSETAEALGYSSLFYFSRAFKRQFGRSPRAWIPPSA